MTIPHKTTITVAHIHHPDPGKKMGKVVAADGQIYWAWPSELGRYAEGETFEIGYKLGGNQGTLRSLVGFPKEASLPVPRQANGTGILAENNPAEKGGIFHDIVPLLAKGMRPTECVEILVRAHHVYEAYKAELVRPKIPEKAEESVEQDFNDDISF